MLSYAACCFSLLGNNLLRSSKICSCLAISSGLFNNDVASSTSDGISVGVGKPYLDNDDRRFRKSHSRSRNMHVSAIGDLLLCSVLRVLACNLSLFSIGNLLLCSVTQVCACNLSPFRIGNLLLCSVLQVRACNLSPFHIGELLLCSVGKILTSS